MGLRHSIFDDLEIGPSTSCIKDDSPGGASLPLSKGLLLPVIYPGRLKQQRDVCVFVRELEADADHTHLIKLFNHSAQYLKQLRHPQILQFASLSTSRAELCLITERVRPLYSILESIEALEVVDGLWQLSRGIQFLHNLAQISHNNVCMESVFVSSQGVWKFGCFEYATGLGVAPPSECSNLPDISCSIAAFVKKTPHGLDTWAFGGLMENLLPLLEDDSNFDRISHVVNGLLDIGAECQLHEFNNDFANDLSQTVQFLRDLPLKSNLEKDAFFMSLKLRLCALPEQVIARRLVVPLLSRFVLLETQFQKEVLPCLITPRAEAESSTGLLSPPLYKRYVVPELLKIFFVRESSVRLALLANFDRFFAAVPQPLLEKYVMPELLIGMKDTNALIVAASMHALANLIPVLGMDVVTGLRHEKYFTEGKPRCSAVLSKEPNGTTNLPEIRDETVSEPKDFQKSDSKRNERIEKMRQRNEAKRLEQLHRNQDSNMVNLDDDTVGNAESVKESVVPNGYESDRTDVSQASSSWSGDQNGLVSELPSKQSPKINLVSNGKPNSPPPIIDSNYSNTATGSPRHNSAPALSKKPAAPLRLLTGSLIKKQPPAKPKAELGAEFDIASLKIDPNIKFDTDRNSIEEIDFFADMKPELKDIKSLGTFDLPATTSGRNNVGPSTTLFQMTPGNETTAEEGWDDNW